MVSKERRKAFEKMGQAPLVTTQWTNSKYDQGPAHTYVVELKNAMHYEPSKKVSGSEFSESKAAAPSAKQDATVTNKIFPTNALYRYLLRPIRETFIELFSGRRVTTNLLKLLGGAIFIATVVAAVALFPPIAPFFTLAALTSPVGIVSAIGVMTPLVLAGIVLFNSVISSIEKFARKRHWDRYENFRSTVKRWDKAYAVPEETLSNMNAYLFNKLQNAKNKQIKKILTKLIDKKLDVGDKPGAHAAGIFFVKELEILAQEKQKLIEVISNDPKRNISEDATLIALEVDLKIVANIVGDLGSSTLPNQTLESLKPAYATYLLKELQILNEEKNNKIVVVSDMRRKALDFDINRISKEFEKLIKDSRLINKTVPQYLKPAYESYAVINKATWKQGIGSRIEELKTLLDDNPENKNASVEKGVAYYTEIFSALGDLDLVDDHLVSRKAPKMVFSEQEREELKGWVDSVSSFKRKLNAEESLESKALEERVANMVSGPKKPGV